MARPLGAQNKDKPFREALRMEVAAAGDDHKELRRLARSLLELAGNGDIQAIREVADRLDGRPAAESTVTVNDGRDKMSDAELRALIAAAVAGTVSGGNGAAKSDDPIITH